MDDSPASRQLFWTDIIAAIQREWLGLDAAERTWIAAEISSLARKQQSLHRLVTAVDGETICRDCGGACCDHGCYHPTLVTILAHLVQNQPLPVPDFTRSCPYLDAGSCQFLPHLRPYNCLTFICERIDHLITPAQEQEMRDLEREIRQIYTRFDRRYLGSSLRGLMHKRSGAGPRGLLSRRDMPDCNDRR